MGLSPHFNIIHCLDFVKSGLPQWLLPPCSAPADWGPLALNNPPHYKKNQTEFLPTPKVLFPVSPGNHLNKPITSFQRNEEQSNLLVQQACFPSPWLRAQCNSQKQLPPRGCKQ